MFAYENTDNCNYQGHEPSTAISAAIAEISAHRRQQENVIRESLNLHKQAPTASQFTFTCESGVPGTVQWPGMYPNTSIERLILANLLHQVNRLEAALCQQTHRPCQLLPIHLQWVKAVWAAVETHDAVIAGNWRGNWILLLVIVARWLPATFITARPNSKTYGSVNSASMKRYSVYHRGL